MKYTVVSSKDLFNFDNFSASFWCNFEKEIEKVKKMNKEDLKSLIKNTYDSYNDYKKEVSLSFIRNNKETIERGLGVSIYRKLETELKEDNINLDNYNDMKQLKKYAIVILYIDENLSSEDTKEKANKELENLMKKIEEIKELI